MSWAEEQSWFGMEEEIAEKEQHMRSVGPELDQMSDERALRFILRNSDKRSLNSIVLGGKFPAYDIAEKILQNGWTPTEKQMTAIKNVYIHFTMWS